MKYDHTPLTLPITDAQKTKATELARLQAARLGILMAARAIDNIVGTDMHTDSLAATAHQIALLQNAITHTEQQEKQAPVDLAEITASRADEADRDARQEERRKKHPVLAGAIDRVNQTLTDVEAAELHEKCPVLAEALDNRPRTLADVEEPRPLPKITRHFTLEEIRVASDECAGFCIACGSYHEACEPDARNYKCEECGELQVFGADELKQMGLVK